MRLRLLCAYGREFLSEGDLKVTKGFSLDNAIALDDEEDYNRLCRCLRREHAPWPRIDLIRRLSDHT